MLEEWVNKYTASVAAYLADGNLILALNDLSNLTCHCLQTDELRTLVDDVKLAMPTMVFLDKAAVDMMLEPLRRIAIAAGPNNAARSFLFMEEARRAS